MSIAVQCGRCNGRFSAPNRALGHSAPCPTCGNQITVEPHGDFETAPAVRVSDVDIALATSSQRSRSNAPLLGVGIAAAIVAIAATAFFALKSGHSSNAVAN